MIMYIGPKLRMFSFLFLFLSIKYLNVNFDKLKLLKNICKENINKDTVEVKGSGFISSNINKSFPLKCTQYIAKRLFLWLTLLCLMM